MTIKRINGKETVQYTLQEYEDQLTGSQKLQVERIGELVIDTGGNPSLPSVWVANSTGHLNLISGGGPTDAGFTQIIGNGNVLFSNTSPIAELAASNVAFLDGNRQTIGILTTPAANSTTPGTVGFRVTPTGVYIDNPFTVGNIDFGLVEPDFATLGNEISTDWTWDLSKNPLAGLQVADMGLLP